MTPAVEPAGIIGSMNEAQALVPTRAAAGEWKHDLGVAAALALASSANVMLSLKKVWHEGFAPLALEAWMHVLPMEMLVSAALVMSLGAGHRRLPDEPARRWRWLPWLAAAGVLLGLALQLIATPVRSGQALPLKYLPVVLQWQVMVVGLLLAAREFAWRSRRASGSLEVSASQRVSLQSALAEARLQLLQAQVEPHFLFNSLANLRRLVRTDVAAAQAMLGDLLRYLREALPRLRDERCTLASETELVRAYLSVHRVRMGARLQVQIEVPESLGAVEVPSMLLLTLAENAIKHGLQPVVEGGSITITATRHADPAPGRIVLRVADTGRGMGSGIGHGTGLANLRARLRAMFGSEATLGLQVNEPSGVVVTVTLPLRADAP